MVRLSKIDKVQDVILNAATAKLFGQDLPVARFLLHELQLTPAMTAMEAQSKLMEWH